MEDKAKINKAGFMERMDKPRDISYRQACITAC